MQGDPAGRLRGLGSLGLALASALLCLSFAEAVLRGWLDEVDYLKPRLTPHAVMPWVIEPGTGGHDLWGFRNPAVPERADIVAIGDSQTYGVSAPMREAWPAWLSRASGLSVYNLAVGGYGPPDYLHLLREYVPRLDPRAVVIGLYLGNDLPRAAEGPGGYGEIARRPDHRILGGLRSWLASRSLLYQVAKFELPALVEELRWREARSRGGEHFVWLEDGALRTAFDPEKRLDALDPDQPRNRKGVTRTKETLLEIADVCARRDLTCFTLVIPTKESVYWGVAQSRLGPAERDRVEAVVLAEEKVRGELLSFLRERSLRAVDPLPAMQAALRGAPLYPASHDGHPNGTGYRIIADEVAAALERAERDPTSGPLHAASRRR